MSLLGTPEQILEALRQAAFIARYGTREEQCGKAYPQGPRTLVPDDWKPGDPDPAAIERGPDYLPAPCAVCHDDKPADGGICGGCG
ncbi:hypothetical protein MARCHEWKA_03400 [Brevundimonas phage vB_BpoS-Marchewka]|uniref:Uncharacterized protein n=1 Tax=Brevundimonas phage vB_BpoS-Marchewka TaxID=2948604 RepID=A0A9E7STX8_9CAUD|nr:hypothetical protein MARCHEWKA_03400 [Brevundimonas phage vB_BpoS-Marchewka]UTC29298.1 hypothetical protein BAMBUS_02160 [Brevundimonas phage vB_BpoS-Bambus]